MEQECVDLLTKLAQGGKDEGNEVKYMKLKSLRMHVLCTWFQKVHAKGNAPLITSSRWRIDEVNK